MRRIQKNTFYLYENDISKYLEEKSSARHVKTIYEAIPGQLSKENKRFVFADLSESLRFTHLETAFDWLIHAGVALPVYRTSEPQFPLAFSKKQSSFKFFLNDIGLLTSRLMGSASLDILNKKANINFGAVFENAAAQELKGQGHNLYYYNSKGLGEVDFLIENTQGDVTLVEIKSGRHYRGHATIDKLLAVDNYSFKDALVFCEGNIEKSGLITYLPIYLIGCL